MASIYIRHEVQDYDAWKPYFDDHASVREEHGEQGYHLFRGVENPNEVSLLFEWDGVENAKRLFESSDTRGRMADAGVVGAPEVAYLDEVESSMPRHTAA